MNPVRRTIALIAAAAATLTVAAVPANAAEASDPPDVVVSLGDSISRGFGADGSLRLRSTYSWATGTSASVNPLAERLRPDGGDVYALTFAELGATAGDLHDQAALARWVRPDVATVMIGANDVCGASGVDDLPDPAAYAADVQDAIDVVRSTAPDVDVLLVSVPDLERLRDVGKGDWRTRVRWAAWDHCSIVLGDPRSSSAATQDRLAAVGESIDGLNAELEAIAAADPQVWSDRGAVHATSFSLGNLSTLDGFHPSVSGQALIAQTVYDAAAAQGMFG
ncbi:Lysophospholipase L1 [Paraoerskovia marina]|uniref:Lysophospholipase L1 n=1 Tax=Paraoerskovia marina TaxID=545619 RepID=A0A1H1M8N1_9CELL|nr:SGNH/GDSL hydrolase family protein [Paraoerskovia marina]SDR82389.1 Lysophospholipase L1 [Paraoerskovia marina]